VISDSGITRISPLTQDKNIYLQLLDRAGNTTALYNDDGTIKESLTDSISISDLADFINENKIFEIDELGNTVFTLHGDNTFYSAKRIDEEIGIFESEIFNGSNDLVKWDNLSWEVTELNNTEVLIYIRTSTSQNDILLADWIGPYTSSQASRLDISNFVGQFIQIKAELKSREKGISPLLHQIIIQTITTESIHFFTTNFVLPSNITKGILTSQKIVPVAADIVFGLNTTNSIDWEEYQEIDENRVFNINQTGQNLRVGIKLISPTRGLHLPTDFDEYGPYGTFLYVNTIDFDFINETGSTQDYHFKITLYADINLEYPVFEGYSFNDQSGFSVDGSIVPVAGTSIDSEEQVNVLYTVPGGSNIRCDTYYFVKIETIANAPVGDFNLYSDSYAFISGCSTSFVDIIDFNFTNTGSVADNYHFRIKFYTDPERTNEFLTVFSGNDLSGWFANDEQIVEAGVPVAPQEQANIVYRPDLTSFDSNQIYYLTIEAHDGSSYVFATNSYTFRADAIQNLEYCGGYMDVPIVKNFALMFELANNQFVTLNI